MRFIGIVFVVAMIAPPALAATENWVVIHHDDFGTASIDVASVVTSGSIRTFDYKLILDKPDADIGARIASQMQIDCEQNTIRSLRTVTYALDGTVVDNFGADENSEAIAPDNGAQVTMRKLVC
jgi:hypothetical protein